MRVALGTDVDAVNRTVKGLAPRDMRLGKFSGAARRALGRLLGQLLAHGCLGLACLCIHVHTGLLRKAVEDLPAGFGATGRHF